MPEEMRKIINHFEIVFKLFNRFENENLNFFLQFYKQIFCELNAKDETSKISRESDIISKFISKTANV